MSGPRTVTIMGVDEYTCVEGVRLFFGSLILVFFFLFLKESVCFIYILLWEKNRFNNFKRK